MKPLVRKSLAEQTADHIQEGLLAGMWTGKLPGVLALSRYFNVSKHTVRSAMILLETQGVVRGGGACRARCISHEAFDATPGFLRIGILSSLPMHEDNAFSQRLISRISENVAASGHHSFIASHSQSRLGYDPRRIVKFIAQEPADAWLVYAPTPDVLHALASSPAPLYSLGGHFAHLPIAGSGASLLPAMEQAVDQLVSLGHRRIVAVCPTHWRHPQRGRTAKAFLGMLQARGLPVGDYNLPDWNETSEGLEAMMSSLFKVTPPTALIVVEPSHTVGVLSFLAKNRLKIPEDLSFMTMLMDPALEWHQPALTTMEWPMEQHVRHFHRWMEKLAAGNNSHDKAEYKTALRGGATFAPAKLRAH